MVLIKAGNDSFPDGRMLDGRSPVNLAPPIALLGVEEGTVNLFVELRDADDQPTGMRLCAVTLTAGQAVPLPDVLPQGAGIVAVGVGTARAQFVGAGDRKAEPGFDLDSAMLALDGMTHSDTPGTGAWMVRAGHDEVMTVTREITAHDLSWVDVTADPENVSEGAQDEEPSPPFFLTASGTLQVSAGSRVVASSTAQVIARDGWDGIDAQACRLFDAVADRLRETARLSSKRNTERRDQDRHLIGSALARLPALMDGRISDAGAAPVTSASLLVRAVANLCEAETIDIDLPQTAEDTGAVVTDLQQFLRRTTLRSRLVELPSQWWKTDGSGFIGFDSESGEPGAVARMGPGRYEQIDSRTGERRRVGTGEAGALSNQGCVLYRPLPYRALKAWDLVRHVLATPARVDLRWALVAALVTTLLGLMTPVITGVIMNEVVPFAETIRLTHMAIGLVMITLGSALFQFVRSVALLRVESFADGALQAAVWDRLLRLPLSFFRRYQVGELMIKAMGPTQLRQALSDAAVSSGLAALFSIVNFGLMLTYDSTLAFAAFGFTLVSGLILFGLTWWQLRFQRSLLRADGAVSGFMLQILFGIQKIRLAGAENRAYARWLGKFSEQRLERYRADNIGNLTVTVNTVLPLLASLMFFAIVGFNQGSIAVGSFIAFNVAFGQFQAAMLSLVGGLSTSLAAIPIYENMKPILDELPEIEPDRRDPGDLAGRIGLHDICFRYDPDGPLILDRVSLDIAPGQFVALVGPSGSGKSTVFRLLLGFEKPESGSVTFDGRDLDHLDLKAVRRQLGVVLQRGMLLPGSIHDNIVGSAGLTEEDAWEAARMAGLEDDVREMPMGMHTMLSEGAGVISGGQRQRLMIARAVVRRPRMLLMDEATSALDNHTQAIVSASLQRMNATRVVIAHRLSTVIHADRIFVIDAGRVVQQGTYDELVNVPGVFQQIASRQLA